MYCDFCGKNLAYNVKYCRHCGRNLKTCSGDTQPLPVIDEVMLSNYRGPETKKTSWYKSIFKKPSSMVKSKVWRIVHYLLACIILAAMVYIVTTFQTIKDYQILIGIEGGILATYIWWRG